MLSIKRKILSVGGSLVIVLPKVWIESRGLKAHDIVEMELGDKLLVTPLGADSEGQKEETGR